MSQYPQPPYPQDPNYPAAYNPSPYGAPPYAVPGGPVRPTSVTVLAILAIILGGLMTLCNGFGVIGGIIQMAGGTLFTGPAGQMKLSSGIQAFQLVNAVVTLILYIALLAIGIGALWLKPWARRLAVPGWSVVMMVWALVYLIVQVVWVNPASMELVMQMQQAQTSRGAPVPPAQMQGVMSAAMIAGAVIWFLIQLILPLCFLSLWRRPHVVAAFAGAAPQAGQPPYPYAPPGGYGNP